MGGDLIIIETLEKKLNEIEQASNCMEVTFNADDIRIINNKTELRTLKLIIAFPSGLKMSKDKFDCFNRIKSHLNKDKDVNDNKTLVQDSYKILMYLVLEFFVLSNPFLEKNVTEVYYKNGFYFLH